MRRLLQTLQRRTQLSATGVRPPARRLTPWFGLIVLAIACALPALGEQVGVDLLPRGTSPILVTVGRPANGDAYPVGGAILVSAEAVGADPIVSLELWADGALAGVDDHSGQGLTFARGTWEWTVTSLGEHVIFVRAVDARGRTAESGVVRLEGIPDPGGRLLYTAAGGETLVSIAEEHGVNPEDLFAPNPGPPDEPLAAGEQVFIPVAGASPPSPSSPSLPPPPATSESAAAAPDSLGSATTVPPAPTLTLAGAGCIARLFIGDSSINEAGFFVYHTGPGASSFTRLATVGAHPGMGSVTFDAPMSPGKHLFFAAAFNAAGESASNAVPFEIPQGLCGSGQSGLHIEGDALVLPKPVDLAYVYYSADDGPWTRLPADPHAYFEPAADAVALGALLASASLDMEVWGWDGGALVFLGTVHTDGPSDVPPSLLAQSGPAELLGCPIAGCTGDIGSTQWKAQFTVSNFAARDFHWMAPAEGVSGGLWQLTSESFSNSCTVSPSGLLLSDIVPTTGGKTFFSIDLGPLAPKPIDLSQQPVQQSVASGGPIVPGVPTLTQDSLLEMKASPGVVLPGAAQSEGTAADAQTAALNPELIVPPEALLDHYYIRVLPIADGQPQCQPSTTVVIAYDPTPEQFDIKFPAPDYTRFVAQYDVEITDYDAPVFPDPNLWGCIRVISVDVKPGDLVAQAWSSLIGKTVCPKSYQGEGSSGFGGLLDDIGSAWDFVVGLYNDLSDLVKDFVAEFNPLCMGAKFTADAAGSGEAKTTIEDACKIGASIAVEVAKAYVGIPPSLPEWEKLDDLGKDYLVELAADEFTAQTGIPCDDECKDLMRDGVDLAYDSLANTSHAAACVSEKEAHENGVEPLCPPSGVKFKAAFGSEYIPPVAWLQVTRLPNLGNAPDPEVIPGCTTSVGMSVEVYFKGGPVSGPYSPLGTPHINVEPMTAHVMPYQGNSAKIPHLAVGEQVTLAVPFKGIYPVLFPWTKLAYVGWQEAPNQNNEDFYTTMRYGTVHLYAYNLWPEYEALQSSGQYPGAANLECGDQAELTVPPSP